MEPVVLTIQRGLGRSLILLSGSATDYAFSSPHLDTIEHLTLHEHQNRPGAAASYAVRGVWR
jgi:hypothetical protein